MTNWHHKVGAVKALLFVLATTSLFYYWDCQRTLLGYQEDSQNELASRASTFGEVVKDTVTLVSATAAALTQNTITEEELSLLVEEFEVMMALNPDFMQVRLLGADGRERLRVESTDKGIVRTPPEALQDKSHRDYFVQSTDLPPRSVHLSSLDFNIENGEIQTPLQPTYRVAAPVRSSAGELLGVFVINLDMKSVLSRLTSSDNDTQYFLYDDEGYLIAGGERKERWGHILSGRTHYEVQHPDVWAQIEGKNFAFVDTGTALIYSDMLSPNSLFETKGEYAPRLLASDETRFYLVSKVNEQSLLMPAWLRTALIFLLILTISLVLRRITQAHQSLIEEKEHEQQRAARLGRLLHHSSELVMITDKEGVIDYVNDAFCKTTGYTPDEVIGKKPSILRSDYHDDKFYQRLWDSLNRGEVFHGLFVNARHDGSHYHEQKTIWPELDTDGNITGFVSLGKDISDTQTLKLAFQDALTGLYNRAMLLERLSYITKLSRRQQLTFTVFYLDLDGFKAVNDSYGHEAGDQVLIQTAQKLKAIFRESDTIARLGGDEFVAITQNISPDDAKMLAGKCTSAMNGGWRIGDTILSGISVSIGIARFEGDEDIEPAHLLEQADMAMYEAKRAGKDRFAVFHDNQTEGHDES